MLSHLWGSIFHFQGPWFHCLVLYNRMFLVALGILWVVHRLCNYMDLVLDRLDNHMALVLDRLDNYMALVLDRLDNHMALVLDRLYNYMAFLHIHRVHRLDNYIALFHILHRFHTVRMFQYYYHKEFHTPICHIIFYAIVQSYSQKFLMLSL